MNVREMVNLLRTLARSKEAFWELVRKGLRT